MNLKLTKVFQKVPEGYIGLVEELPGAYSQANTLEECRTNLEEAIQLVLDTNRLLAEEQLQGQDILIREFITCQVTNLQNHLVKPKGAWRQDSAIGMWENRPEIEDSAAWVKQLRQSEWER